MSNAKLAIRDTIGVALFASGLPWSRIAFEFAKESGGDGRVSLWGSDARTTAPSAALANGTAAHGIEMDDRSHDLDIHNGAPTVPAAVALAEHAGRSGKDLILAVACGYEVGFRMARATQRGIDRFYWVSIRSIFGATAAAAKVLGLDQWSTVNAFGIAGYMASGLWEHTHDPHGTMIKRMQGGGWPANCAVTAALLAQKGFTGPVLHSGRGKWGVPFLLHRRRARILVPWSGDWVRVLKWPTGRQNTTPRGDS